MDLSILYLPTWREGFSPSLNAYYEELAESVKLADRLGWRRVLTTEHHFHYYGGAVPNPAVILAAWARETTNIRLGAGVSLVPLRHPLKVAEDYALVDHLSGGRFEMGISRGFVPHEFGAFGIDQAETADRVAEGIEIIRKFWAGEPFAHKGKFYEFDKIEPWPVPLQKDIPLWIAASNSPDSFTRAGEKGHHIMMNQYPMSRESLSEKFGWYKDAYAKAGHDESKRQAMVSFMAYITDTEEKAIEGATGPLQEHAGAFRKLMLGDQWNRDYAADESVLRAMCESDDIRDVFRKRTLICTPEQAAERIEGYLQEGFTEISLVTRYAGITPEQERETLERMTNEVVPMLGRTLNHANVQAAQ